MMISVIIYCVYCYNIFVKVILVISPTDINPLIWLYKPFGYLCVKINLYKRTLFAASWHTTTLPS